MKCPSCNIICIENSNFCHNCGINLKSLSSTSTSKSISNDQIQDNTSITEALKRLMPTSYVEKLLASQGRSEGERRIVTILFSDIKGSTSIGENLDPEEILNIMNEAFSILIEPIMHYEGTIARLMGDAILAFFGAPIAHEDDPQRACRAALEIISGAMKYADKLEKEKGIKGFSVRVGINTGLVVVAEVGADFRVEYTAMGDEVNTAARMESAAEPGTILITEKTKRQLPESFEVKYIGPIKVKGKEKLIDSYELISENNFNQNIRLQSSQAPLIGREKELSTIKDIINKTDKSKGAVISINGECGVGKSRLIEEVKNSLIKNCNQIEVKSLAYRHRNSYWLIRLLLKALLNEESNFTREKFTESLKDQLTGYDSDKFSELLSVFSYLLDVPTPDSDKPIVLDPRSRKGQIIYAFKEYFKYKIYDKSLVIILEDLQWCDEASLTLINELVFISNSKPILLILSSRKDDTRVEKIMRDNLDMLENFVALSLSPLNKEQSKNLIKNITSDLELSEKFQATILDKAEGNPLFIKEVLYSFIDNRISKKAETFVSGENVKDFTVPDMLQGVITARLDNLNPVDKMVLQSAAVIGRSFNKKLLVNILSDNLAKKEIDDSISFLVKREFLVENHMNHFNSNINSEDSEYLFRQSLIQEVAYNILLYSNRQKFHLKVGNAIEELNPGEVNNIADSIAVHFEKGKDISKACYYYKLAADRARDLFANKEAIRFYEKIISLSEEFSIGSDFLATVYISLGDIYYTISDYDKANINFKKALKFEITMGKKITLNQKMGEVYEHWGKYKEALAAYDISLNLVSDRSDYLLESKNYLGIGMVHYREGNTNEALVSINKAKEVLEKTENELELSDVYNILGIIYLTYNDFEKSYNFLTKSLFIRKKINNIYGLASSFNNLGFLYQNQKKFNQSIESYLESIKLCEKIGNLHGLAKIYDNLSHIYITLNKKDIANEYNLKAMEILGKISYQDSDFSHNVWLQAGVW